jgi:hypothetical protein
MIEVIKTLRKVREVLRVNNRRLLLLSLLHRTILPPRSLFATGTLGAVFFVAGLQRSSELRGSQLRSGLSLRTTRYFYVSALVERRSVLAHEFGRHDELLLAEVAVGGEGGVLALGQLQFEAAYGLLGFVLKVVLVILFW